MIYDAKDVLDLVEDKWELGNPSLKGVGVGQALLNPNFDTGVLTGWTGDGVVDNAESQSPDYSCQMYSNGTAHSISQVIGPASKDIISEFSFYHMGVSSVDVILTFDDETTKTAVIGAHYPYDGWDKVDLLTWVVDPCTGELLFPKDAVVTKIEVNNAYSEERVDTFVFTAAFPEGSILLQLDEYNPNNPDYQILFANRPERIIPITPNVVKHEQDVVVTLFMRLPTYQPDAVDDTLRPMQLSMKEELTRIFAENRYQAIGQCTLIHTNFKDGKFARGLGDDAEPISYASTMIVQLHYYEAVNGNATAIGLRPSSIQILTKDLLGFSDVVWDDTDPWVKLQVPKGLILKQHLLGPEINGKIICHDYTSLHELLYETPTVSGGNRYPINGDNSKTKFSTDIPNNPDFTIVMTDALGNYWTHEFFNVRIKKVELNQANVAGLYPVHWIIHWMADYIYSESSTQGD